MLPVGARGYAPLPHRRLGSALPTCRQAHLPGRRAEAAVASALCPHMVLEVMRIGIFWQKGGGGRGYFQRFRSIQSALLRFDTCVNPWVHAWEQFGSFEGHPKKIVHLAGGRPWWK